MAVPLAFRWLHSFISGIILWIWNLPHQQPENALTPPANPLENLNNGGVNSSPTETEEYTVGMSELQFSMANENQHVSMDSGFSSVVSIAHSSLDNMESPNNGGCGGGAQAGGGGQDGPGNGGGNTSGGVASRDEGGSSGGGSAGSGGDGRRPPAGNLAVPAEDEAPDTQSPGASAPHLQPPTSHQACPDNDNPVYRASGNPRVVLSHISGSEEDNGADRAGMVSTQGTGAPTAPPRETQLCIRNGLHLAENSQERGRARVDETIDMRPKSAMSLRDGATLIPWPESEEDTDDGEDYPDIDMADKRAGIVKSSAQTAKQLTTEKLFEEEVSSHQDTGRRSDRQITQALSIRAETGHVSSRDTVSNLDRPPESDPEEGASSRSQDMPVKKRSKKKDKTSTGGCLCKFCNIQRSDVALHPCRCCLCKDCCLRYLGERRMIGRFSRDPCPECGQDVHRVFDIAQSG